MPRCSSDSSSPGQQPPARGPSSSSARLPSAHLLLTFHAPSAQQCRRLVPVHGSGRAAVVWFQTPEAEKEEEVTTGDCQPMMSGCCHQGWQGRPRQRPRRQRRPLLLANRAQSSDKVVVPVAGLRRLASCFRPAMRGTVTGPAAETGVGAEVRMSGSSGDGPDGGRATWGPVGRPVGG